MKIHKNMRIFVKKMMKHHEKQRNLKKPIKLERYLKSTAKNHQKNENS